MKKVTVGQEVICEGHKGVVETIRDGEWVTVILRGTDGWPFPTRKIFRVRDLRRYSKKRTQSDGDFEEAPW